MLEIRVGGAGVRATELVDQLDSGLAAPAEVDSHTGRDRERPGAEVLAVPELRVAAEGPEEGLLEGVVCGVRADDAAQVGVDRISVLLVETLERREAHGLHHLL